MSKTPIVDEFDKTLVRNTGYDSQGTVKQLLSDGLEVGIDYFRGTVWLDSQEAVEHLMEGIARLLDDCLIWEYNQGSFMGKQWQHRGRSIKGVSWWWSNPGDGQAKAHLLISMSGRVMSQIPVREFWGFCRDILALINFKVTRLDICIDDYFKRLNELDIKKAAEVGNFAIVKTISPYRTHKKGGFVEGFTWYFGSKNSDNFARFYDKAVESKGEIDSYRLEGQFADEKAHLIWKQWLAIPDSDFDDISPRFLSGSVLGLVEFTDRLNGKGGREKNISRMNRLPWWQQFIEACGAHIRHSVARPDTSLDRAKKWIEKQVMPTLAVIQKAMGLLDFRGWLDEGMAKAAANFNAEQSAKVMQWSKGQSDVNQQVNGAVEVIDMHGDKWIWVYRKTPAGSDWTRARFYGRRGQTNRVRFSGEKAVSVPARACHFGDEKPTWRPQAVAELVVQWHCRHSTDEPCLQ
jgi:hypothetical protein